MKITKVKDPKGIVHGHNGKTQNLSGTFFLLEMTCEEFGKLPERLIKQLTVGGHWTDAYELDEESKTAKFYLRRKDRWGLLLDLSREGKFSYVEFLGYIAMTRNERVSFKGAAAFLLISLFFSPCIKRATWRVDLSSSYLIERSKDGRARVVVPASQYASLMGDDTARYQYALERLRSVNLEIEVSHS